jgi:hypothetical protein
MPLTEQEIDIIAERMVKRVRETHHDFWIDNETHYNDHQRLGLLSIADIHDLSDLLSAYRNARSLFWRAFLGLAIIGSLALAFVGFGVKIGH